MIISLFVISSTTIPFEGQDVGFFTHYTKVQLRYFILGSLVYFLVALVDYRKLKNYSLLIYLVMLISLIGLFFVPAVHGVNRWYRLPFISMALQPSEYAKVAVVISLSSYLEKYGTYGIRGMSLLGVFGLVFLPFILILKQPDLGTALILFPITLVMLYFAGASKRLIRCMGFLGCMGIFFSTLMFMGVLSHQEMKPYVTKVLKEYQYERLNPNNYHQEAAQTAIALGGLTGSGWKKSNFTAHQWLPEAHTDSVFPAFTEQFGFIGALFLLFLFGMLLYFSFQVVAVAPDSFGKLLSAGISVYLAMHVIVNIGMMCGILPITGVPLILITYGGSSVLATMGALGLLQSIYIRRF